ncbi:MAG: family 2 glycosyl transferase [Bacteroidota bacterium]
MPQSDIYNIGQIYFKRFESWPSQILEPLSKDTKVILVIPCYKEPNITITLNSLADCLAPQCPIEVLIVINASEQDPAEVHLQNRRSQKQVAEWVRLKQPDFLSCQVIYNDSLPSKHAGVGLARKIGMDEALRRFMTINYDGLIINLDADCTVASNYLTVLEQTWLAQEIQTLTVYFEHSLSNLADPRLREGIIYYELFLRYYINGLRYAQFPYAFHTVGSSMGCRATTYSLSGGMNRRKAGEDFYFLHKTAQLGKVVQLTNTTVYPSARTSDRVPFGTGKAQQDWLAKSGRHQLLYHPQSFEDVKQLLAAIPGWYQTDQNWNSDWAKSLPTAIAAYLEQQHFPNIWDNLRAGSRSWPVFQKKFFAWWDGFRVLKFVHFARDHYYQQIPAEEAGFRLLKKLCILYLEEVHTTEELLLRYRTLDQQNY